MEVLASILGSVVAEIGRFLCGFVYTNTKSAVRFQSNLDTLVRKTKALMDIRNEVEEQVDSANAQGSDWLREVEKIKLEVNSLQECLMADNSRHCGCFLNCGQRCRFATEVARMLKEVKRLLKDGNIIAVTGGMNYPTKKVEHIPGRALASSALANIMDLLNDDRVRKIGVWGMGGVGKTTLVKNLNNKLKSMSSTQPFSIVIWVTVSKELDLQRVQTQIAERLNLKVNLGETVERMAIRLHQRLEKERNFLLILDDVWETIDFDCLGVPDPEVHMGSKVILTSRSKEICREMKTDVDVKVDVLNDEEAWQLFRRNAGEVATLKHIKPIAEAVARECSGLPLAIITVGTAMRGKTRVELWKDSLNELRRSVPYIKGIENRVYKPLKWSYDSLQGTNIKPCFLYCCLFPEDYSIDVNELVKCWLAEGLIGENQNFEDSLNRGIAILENLKDSCLLEQGTHDGTVKMHDVVRDVAIWIVSSLESECKSLVQSGLGLTQMPEARGLKSIKRVSFMNNKIARLPYYVSECSDTSTLLLQGNRALESIPEGFLEGFSVLKVLNVSRTNIESLPLSLAQLGDLRALLLKDCSRLKGLPPLGGLSRLQVLDISGTHVKELPTGLERLSNLRILDLSRTHYLENIQAGIISMLSGLEVLDMKRSAYKWVLEKGAEEGQATFEELRCLTRLHDISIRLDGIPILNSEVLYWFSRLRRFHIIIGPSAYTNYVAGKYDDRVIILSGVLPSENRNWWIVTNANSMVLHNCSELSWIFKELITRSILGFVNLKSLSIMSCGSLGPIEDRSKHDCMPNLEELRLHHLPHLFNVWELNGKLGLMFSMLTSIDVFKCPRLKYLFPESAIPILKNLEEIKATFCEKLVSFFQWNISDSSQELPSLRRLELTNLPMFNRFSECTVLLPRLEQIHVYNCRHLAGDANRFESNGHGIEEMESILNFKRFQDL